MRTIDNNVQFRFTKRGSEKGIEIHFGQGFEFWSCRRGTDLMDFDALLEYFIPEIDFERITHAIAREWEKALYREQSQCKSQVGARKALDAFLQQMRSGYSKQVKRAQTIEKLLVENFMPQVKKGLSQKTGRLQAGHLS